MIGVVAAFGFACAAPSSVQRHARDTEEAYLYTTLGCACIRQMPQTHLHSSRPTRKWDRPSSRHTPTKGMCRIVVTDTQTGMLPGIPGSAMCVQGFDDSLNSAIHTTYRISLRPSSLRLPRHPWFAIVKVFCFQDDRAQLSARPPFGFALSGCLLG